MQSTPLQQWYCHREKNGLSTLSFYLPEMAEDKLAVLMRYWVDGLENMEEPRCHKWGGHVRSVFCEEFGAKLFFKRFSIRSPRHFHKPYRARATVVQEGRLSDADITAPESIGLIELRRFGVLIDSAVVSEELTGFIPLNLCLRDSAHQGELNLLERRSRARSLGRFIGYCHREGFFHGDMHVANIMCKFENDEFDFAWIDNEEGMQFRGLPVRKRIHDLNHLNRAEFGAPPTDRLRFWQGYSAECDLGSPKLRTLIRKLSQIAKRYRKKKSCT